MAAALGSLVVSLGLDAAEFVSGLTKSEYQAKRFVQGVTAGAARVAGVLGGIATAAVGAALALEKGAESIAVYKDLSEQIGDTAENVAGLQLAADMSGVALDAAAAASVKLTAALSKTDDEGKGAGAGLAAINIQLDEFKKLSPVAQLQLVADQLAKYEDGSQKTAVAVALFGKTGAQLLPLLNDLADVGSRNSKLTQEQIEEADKLTKQFGAMKGEVRGLVQSLTADFIPGLGDVAKAMREAYRDGGPLLALWVGLGGAAANALGVTERQQTAARLKEIEAEIDVAKKQLESGSLNPAGAGKSFFNFLIPDVKLKETAIARLRETVGALEAEKARILAANAPPAGTPKPTIDITGLGTDGAAKASEAQRYLESLQKQGLAAQDLSAEVTALFEIESGRLGKVTAAETERILAAARVIDGIRAQQDETKRLAEIEKDAAEARKRSLSDGAAIYAATRTPAEALGIEIERLNRLLQEGVISWDTYARAQIDAQDKFDKATKDLKEKGDEWDEFAKNAARGIQEQLGDGLYNIMTGKFSDIGKSFEDMILRMVAQAQAAKLARWLLGDLVEGGEGGGALGGVLEGIFGIFGGAKAIGGPAAAGRMYEVAENRPEMLNVNGRSFLMMGNQRGHIDPNPRLGGSGSMVVNNTFVLQGNPGRQTQQQIAAAAGLSVSRATRRNN